MNNNQNNNIRDYIFQQLQSGQSAADITTQLRGAGLDDTAINQAFNEAQTLIAPATPSTYSVPHQNQVPASPVESPSQPVQLPPAPKRGALKTGWLLFKQSLFIIKQNPSLWRYMVMSIVLNIIISTIYIISILLDIMTKQNTLLAASQASDGTTEYIPTIAFYICTVIVGYLSTVITYYYATGLTSHVLAIFSGKPSTYTENMSIAVKRLPAILTYGAITLIIGYILRFIEQRFKWIGFIVSKIIGVAWELATTFVIAIIADDNKNAVSSIKDSVHLFRTTWGETVTSRITLMGMVYIIYFALMIPLAVVLVMALGNIFDPIAGIVVAVSILCIGILVIAVLDALAMNVLNTALYYYAKNKAIPPSFTPELIASAFVNKKKK